MPSGTSLCAEGEGGTETETGTVAKPPLILLVGVSPPRPTGSVEVSHRQGGVKEKKVQLLV